MKKALLVVSFGTSYPDTLRKSICAMENELARAFPDRDLYRAFTSGVIRRKLYRRDKTRIDGVVEALEALRLEGYEDVLLQPTHMINGAETQRLLAEAALYSHQFPRFSIGAPLLTRQEDYELLAEAVMEEMPPLAYDEALVLMGHGTEHYANPAYPALEYVFHARGYTNVFVGTVEGYPPIGEVIHRLDETLNARRVYVAPLMIVAGDHAYNDMIGSQTTSWTSQLLAHNYQPMPILKGLGEYPAVRCIFVAHARAALEENRA
ncbi:MAG: sirohydrochlorin cobaltochelatase [Clostridiales bacterium]|nr:sirohydrochlorin cobaltochelatase [Clostridiales bacterium]